MKDIRYQYIPEQIIRAWENAEGKLGSYSTGSGDVLLVSKEDVFIENVTVGKKDTIMDFFHNDEYSSFFEKLQKGDDSLSDDDKYLVKELMSLQFYCNMYSTGRFFELFSQKVKSINEAVEATLKKRTSDDIFLQHFKAMFYLTYLLDLEAVLVSAPEGSSFLLSDAPLFLCDPAFGPEELLTQRPYTANGTILFMPVSPKYAVAAYDRFIYKPLKTGGKIVLSKDDVDEFNSCSVSFCDTVVFDTSLTDVEYIKSLSPKKRTASLSYSPSVFGIRARYVDVQEIAGRAYCGMLEISDSKYISENGQLMISGEEQIRRHEKALEMLEDMRSSGVLF